MFTSVGLDAVAQPVTVPEEKGLPRETAKEDINPVVLSKELVNLDDDEIEEVKRKVCLNPNLKASSNVIFVQHHWRKYSQVQRGVVEKPTRKLPFIQRPTMRKKFSSLHLKFTSDSRFNLVGVMHDQADLRKFNPEKRSMCDLEKHFQCITEKRNDKEMDPK
ncbi:uncharacterized protein TNIN_163481 [Trichonephila inaurata madagascariensis]|uniref:Uncharacterized protein n=1 Tax=Trichonephila inaurata madagascariensis TaxID=2747483 RepID=A0A8X7BZD3_9ARAC|nr:uncharacterized protein TNIN_163481 [Trichonephila inaurata madagascariensis]